MLDVSVLSKTKGIGNFNSHFDAEEFVQRF